MVTILICAIIGMIFFGYDSDWRFDLLNGVMSSFTGIMVGGLLGLILAIILPLDTYDKQYSLNIESLQDNSVDGNFFLGTGNIGGKMKYTFYYEENKLYRMVQLDYDLVQIKYSDNRPKVNVTEKFPTESLINYFAWDFDCFSKTYIIEVPKNTNQN